MTDEEKRKAGGSKLARSETVTVRLDPKLRYLAELAARHQRRTLSSYVEWAIEDSLRWINLDSGTTLHQSAERLWDVDEPDRFVRLALSYEHMLTHEEQVIWKLIRENGYLWRGRYDANHRWTWQIRHESLIFERLRESWNKFVAVAKGEAAKDSLPTRLLRSRTWQKRFRSSPVR
jgi:hypothetical protein